ncbi:MAG: ABC transporter ATP-binding protein [Acidimicrobiia bacterium]
MHQTLMGFRRDNDSLRGKKVERALIRRVLGLTRPYRGALVGFLVTVVISTVIGIIPAFLFRALIDDALGSKNESEVLALAAAAVAVALVSAVLSLLQRWYSARVGEGLIYDMRVSLFDHLQRLPISFFTRAQTGSIMSRINNDVIGAQQAVTNTIGTVIQNAITIVVTLAAMATLEWRLTLLTLVVVPAFLWPARRVGRRLQTVTREGFILNASMNNTISERFNVAGALVVKLFGSHDRERDEFGARAARVRDIGVASAMYSRVLLVALTFVAAVGTAIVYYVGGRMVIDTTISVGTLAAFVLLVAQIYQPVTQITNARVDVLTALVSFERVFEVLDFPALVQEKPGAYDLIDPAGRIELDHVWFRHPAPADASLASLEEGVTELDTEPSEWILRDVSFTVAPGEFVALVGPSGAGKTTTAMLVPRIADVEQGAVRIDGHDVRELTLATLRDSVGVVMQDPHLFHDTIRTNLRYAKPDASDADLEAACRAARIHDLITSLPDGYDTIVGERGYRMSGGEKQRLAIARVLLKEPAIIILDEATSHLDSESEHQIQRALDAALHGRTAVVIAHRLSTIVNADRILVFDGGRIVEQGTHDELLASGGLYADLYRTQRDREELEHAPSLFAAPGGVTEPPS